MLILVSGSIALSPPCAYEYVPLVVDQDFRPGFLATPDCTSNRLRWSRFSHAFHHQRLRRPEEGASSVSSGQGNTQKCLIPSDLSYTSPPRSFLRPDCLLAAARYPPGKGSAAIRRTIAPKSRRVRWPCARRTPAKPDTFARLCVYS